MMLTSLELTESEEQVLKILIGQQGLTATECMKASGFHRKVIYDILTRLETRAFIVSEKQRKERIYAFAGAASIKAHIDEIQTAHAKQIAALNQLVLKLEEVKPQENVTSYTLTGTTGVRYILTELLEKYRSYVVIGAPEASQQIMGEHFWLNFHQKQREKGIAVRAIFNKSLEAWKGKTNNPRIKIKTFERIEPLTEQIITADLVITIVWTDIPRTHVVKSTQYAQSQKTYFELLWKDAR